MMWLILLLAFSVLFYYKIARYFSYWKDKGVPYEKSIPIIGSLSKILFQQIPFFDFVQQQYNEFRNERYFGSVQFSKPVLTINDPELIKLITVKDFDYFMDRNTTIKEDGDPIIGQNLTNLKGQRWRDMRATLSPAFTSSKIKIMFTLVSECAKDFIDYFEKQNKHFQEVEMKDAFTRFTNDAIATVAFGLEVNSLKDRNNEFYKMGKKTTTFNGIVFVLFLIHTSLPKIAKALHLPLIPSSVKSFFKRIIKETLNKREEEGFVRPDMIQLLIEARKGVISNDAESNMSQSEKTHKIELTDDDIVAQALIFFIAGFETSSSLMCFIAYELALNQEVQKKLQNEIDETLIKCNGKLTYDAINKMKYMDMIVSETLRKWPPGFMIDRVCVKDYLIKPSNAWEKPLLVEKGVVVQIPIVGLHRDPKYFPNPNTFDPERFSDKNKHTIKNFTYFPFGSGPRLCIASRFALMENKTIIFYLLSKFDIIKTEKTPYPLKFVPNSLSLGPIQGYWLGLQKRELFQ